MVSMFQIQNGWKVPGVSIEVDPSQAGTPTNPKYALLMGHKTSAGTGVVDVPIACGSQADADSIGGRGSMLASMFRTFFGINKSTPLFVVPIAEPGAGVAATGTITVAAAPTASGVLSLYIGGRKVTVSIGQTDTTAQVATKINTAVNADLDLPVTSTVATNVVTLTAKWKGLTGNDIRVEDSILGQNGGESLPTTLGLTYSGSNFLTGGTGTPDLTSTIANFGDYPYKFVADPFTDSASLAALATEFGFSDSGRWGWLRQSYGQVYSARRDTYSGHVTWGAGFNYPVIYPMAFELQSPSPVWEWAAAYTAQAGKGFGNDPAAPLQFLTLDGIRPAPRNVRFNKSQLHTLASTGLSIQGTDIDGQQLGVPQILREQSQYQKNSLGQADNAYELATTLATLDEIFTRLRQRLTNKFARAKLANDNTPFGAGQNVVTPKIIKGEIIALYSEMQIEALVENMAAFKANLIVERSKTDPNAVEVYFPPDIINQLRRTNVRAAFRLQFPLAA